MGKEKDREKELVIKVKRTIRMIAVCLLLGLLTGCSGSSDEPVKLVFWHYYNDNQKARLDELIQEYNETEGKEEGIVVEAFCQGSVNELSEKIMLILNQTTNEVDKADMFLSYRDVTSDILTSDAKKLVDYQTYFTDEELAYYNESYLKEGYFDGALYILPVAKSTELLMMNETRLQEFLEANTDYDREDLSTWEGLERLAQGYYEWTDAMTPEAANDGKALIGMDVLPNYFITQNHAMGSTVYHYDAQGNVIFDLRREVIDVLFDQYYIPYTKGYYGAYGRYRSDDLRQSLLVGYIGSSSSISYFPKATMGDGEQETQIELGIYRYPHDEDGALVAIQQGAGIVTVASEPEREKACAHFIKWLTQKRGVAFASMLSYMPAGRETLEEWQAADIADANIKRGIATGIEQSQEYEMVYGFDFKGALDTRTSLDEFMMGFLEQGRSEFLGYLTVGMTMEEAAEAMNYGQKQEAFWQSILELFQESGL